MVYLVLVVVVDVSVVEWVDGGAVVVVVELLVPLVPVPVEVLVSVLVPLVSEGGVVVVVLDVAPGTVSVVLDVCVLVETVPPELPLDFAPPPVPALDVGGDST
jgi:hypothetical protein